MSTIKTTRNLLAVFLMGVGVIGFLNSTSCDGGSSTDGGGGGGGNREFVSGDLSPAETYTHAFNTANSFSYYCRYHRSMGMTGVITVNSAGTPNKHNLSISTNTNLPDLTIEVGDTITWTNNTGQIHTVESDN